MNIFIKQTRPPELEKNEFWALKAVNFCITKGESVGFYGPNGAGKSTILKLLARVTYPTKGTITVTGRVAPLLEIGAGFHPELTGHENVFVNGAILGMRISEVKKKYHSIVDFAEIAEFMEMPIKKFSSGMYLRLAFSIAIHSDANIFLIDEIITVGDESFQKKCLDKIQELRKKNKTIIVVTHNKPLMEQISDRIFIVESGHVVKAK